MGIHMTAHSREGPFISSESGPTASLRAKRSGGGPVTSSWPAAQKLASDGIMCLTGIMNLDPQSDTDATTMNRNMVLRNQVLFGTVNAGRRHWEQAAQGLAAADQSWLSGLITRRVPLASWTEALDRQPEDIKVVVGPDRMSSPDVQVWSVTLGLLSEGRTGTRDAFTQRDGDR